MEYTDFIKELRPLREEAHTLFDEKETHQSPKFRKWRHKVTTLLTSIEEEGQGYSIDCNIRSRDFLVPSYGEVSQSENIAAYNCELQDTVNEIDTIIELFDKYGDPKSKAGKEENLRQRAELEWPPKMTLSWLFKHAPISLWVQFLGALIAAFLFGIAFSQTGLYANIRSLLETTKPEIQTTKEPNNALKSDFGDDTRPSVP